MLLFTDFYVQMFLFSLVFIDKCTVRAVFSYLIVATNIHILFYSSKIFSVFFLIKLHFCPFSTTIPLLFCLFSCHSVIFMAYVLVGLTARIPARVGTLLYVSPYAQRAFWLTLKSADLWRKRTLILNS